jgi:DNA (cytosine-5)-methyltransferase 1
MITVELQGVPDSFQFVGNERAAYRMIGNGVAIPMGRWIGRETVRYFKRN